MHREQFNEDGTHDRYRIRACFIGPANYEADSVQQHNPTPTLTGGAIQ